MNTNYYLTHQLSTHDGYTWTLASRVGAMLQEIENLYGERDKSWTFIGIEFEQNGPKIWFPGNCSNIAIQLNTNALNNEILAHYQLAHEVIHLLAPDGKMDAPNIEEGLATVYSEDFVLREHKRSNLTSMVSYVDAAERVRELLAFDALSIKKLRAIEPSFKKMTVDTFKAANLNFPDDKVAYLLSIFLRK